MRINGENPGPSVYQSEKLPQGLHYYATVYPEIHSLTNEVNFHGLVKPTLKRPWGSSLLNFLLKTEEMAQDIIHESEQKHPLRGSEGVTEKIHFWGQPLAIKAIYSNGLTGYKNSSIFSDPVRQIFNKHGLKTIEYSAATPHALIRPWIEGLTLDAIFQQLEQNNKELATSIYLKLSENKNILSANQGVFSVLTELLERFGFQPVINSLYNKIIEPDDQITSKAAAFFSRYGEEGRDFTESEKIKMTVDFSLPPIEHDNSITFIRGQIKDRLGNWILPNKSIRQLSKAADVDSIFNLLLSNMICHDPFYIRKDIGYPMGIYGQ